MEGRGAPKALLVFLGRRVLQQRGGTRRATSNKSLLNDGQPGPCTASQLQEDGGCSGLLWEKKPAVAARSLSVPDQLDLTVHKLARMPPTLGWGVGTGQPRTPAS